MASKRTIKKLMASPGDLAREREAYKKTLDDPNLGQGDGAVEFIPLGWATRWPPPTASRSQ